MTIEKAVTAMTLKEKLLSKTKKADFGSNEPDSCPKSPISSSPSENPTKTEIGARCADIPPIKALPQIPKHLTKIVPIEGDLMAFARVRTREPLQPYEPQRDRKGHWKEGVSGNPAGGSIDFSEYAYRMTGGGQEMIDHALQTMRGSVPVRWEDDHGNPCERMAPAQLKDQADARAWLDRAIQPAKERAAKDAGVEEAWNMNALTDDEFLEFKRLLAKVRAPPTIGLASQAVLEAEIVPTP